MQKQVWQTITRPIVIIGIGLLFCGQPSLGLAQNDEPAMESWGKDLFVQHCAACHGLDGKGEGPMAATLKKPPANLTLLTKQNGGSFPRAEVLKFVDGERPIPSHGSRQMPIWGEVFRREKSATEARMRIFALASYVESLQEK
jgi:mono/diheme cytochrome c family protein